MVPQTRPTVLIVEDEPGIRNFAARVLQLEDYEVLQAAEVNSGLGLLNSHAVDLVLLDLRMPERDGWSMLAEMKTKPASASIPVIVFSASAEGTTQEKALAMGAQCYLVKPLSAATLRESVACFAGKRGTHGPQKTINSGS